MATMQRHFIKIEAGGSDNCSGNRFTRHHRLRGGLADSVVVVIGRTAFCDDDYHRAGPSGSSVAQTINRHQPAAEDVAYPIIPEVA
jgi:hypothetical protein